MNIIIIDDEPIITQLLESHLAWELSHTVSLFNDAVEALDSYQKNSEFDIAIVDFYMPRMCGDILIEKMLKENPLQKFIVSSGIMNDEIEALVNKHRSLISMISKPFEFVDLDQVIERVIKN